MCNGNKVCTEISVPGKDVKRSSQILEEVEKARKALNVHV